MSTPVDRRTFLAGTAATAAALSTAPLLAAVDPKKPGGGMRLGLVTYLWGQDWDLPTLIANCAKSKISGVELRTTHKHGVEPVLNAKQRAEVKARFEDSPVACVGPGSNERFDHKDPAQLKAAIEKTKAFIRLSHDIGGTGVKVKPNSWQKGVPREQTLEQIGKALAELGEDGLGFGQEIRVEVHGSIGNDFEALKKIAEVADHPSVKYCWNSNDADLAGKGMDHHYDLIRKWFGATLHVREFNVGKYPYPKLIERLTRDDYAGWILLECSTKPADRVAALAEQLKLFQAMVEKAQAKL